MAMPRLGWVWRLNARQNHLNGSFGWLAGPGSLALVETEKVSKHFNRSAGLQTQTETIPRVPHQQINVLVENHPLRQFRNLFR